jgi:hypothetical protein
MNLNEQAQRIHKLNHKWWHDRDGVRLERNRGELLMLVVSELAEAMEALRKDAQDDKLPHRKGEEVELADAYIRLLDFAAGFDVTIENLRSVPPCGDNKAEQLLEIVSCVTDTWLGSNEEVSYAVSAILDYAVYHGLDLDGAVEEKLAYNQTRKDHTYEAREAANGKRF